MEPDGGTCFRRVHTELAEIGQFLNLRKFVGFLIAISVVCLL